MKEKYGKIVLGAALIIAVILMFACSSGPTVPTAPCCEVEEPDLTRDYEGIQTGSHDFFLVGEPVGKEGYCACTCCGVYIMDDPDIISEHLKTCCP
jgi:hypothetical protein